METTEPINNFDYLLSFVKDGETNTIYFKEDSLEEWQKRISELKEDWTVSNINLKNLNI